MTRCGDCARDLDPARDGRRFCRRCRPNGRKVNRIARQPSQPRQRRAKAVYFCDDCDQPFATKLIDGICCRCRNGYAPTPEEIRAECAAIRKTWDKHRWRREYRVVPVEFEERHIGTE